MVAGKVAGMVGWRECCQLVAGSALGGEWWSWSPESRAPSRGLRHSSVAEGAVGVVRPVITVSPGALGDSRACGRWGGGGGWLVEP